MGIISEATFADLTSLTEHGRIPTELELDRFIKGRGYIKKADCEECFYKIRYTPPRMYDSDFGRITGTQRP